MTSAYQPLNAYFMMMPLEVRRMKRIEYASLQGISVKASHHFINNHPLRLEAIKRTEEFTGYEVTRFDLFPDVFKRDELIELIEKTQ